MAAIRIRRSCLEGLKIISFQTPSPCHALLEEAPPRENDAASTISFNLSSASSFVSEVLIRTFLASSLLPRITSHRGDSGIAKTPIATTTAGTAASPSMSRQFKVSGRPDRAEGGEESAGQSWGKLSDVDRGNH
ncbi:hypothetical protein G4B88_008824 [Cannabis sativa]|uniref:Uncharacterized protein n=1 Tax=Cannabis sativa TaxID=3483 RepID=A0A7J6DM43_CANSA|nr:hypothetical protein G4B88_008824 [Cannabis sativa]